MAWKDELNPADWKAYEDYHLTQEKLKLEIK